MNNTQDEYDVMNARVEEAADIVVDLKTQFIPHSNFFNFEKRVISVMADRERSLRAGHYDLEGACLVGSSGSGKSTLMNRIISDYNARAAANSKLQFGNKIVSVVVPSGAGIKETYLAILKATNGYDIIKTRTEDYLKSRVIEALEEERVAGVYLDEFQDLGRLKSTNAMKGFATSFRHLMQTNPWPVCLIITGTTDMKSIINAVPTFARRLEPQEFRPMLDAESELVVRAIKDFTQRVGIKLSKSLWEEDEFLARLIHAGCAVFGLTISMVIAAIREAVLDEPVPSKRVLRYIHFIRAYDTKTDADEEFNPFLAKDWSSIDTRKLMTRKHDE